MTIRSYDSKVIIKTSGHFVNRFHTIFIYLQIDIQIFLKINILNAHKKAAKPLPIKIAYLKERYWRILKKIKKFL
jgi:hypothetical protein